MLAFLLLLTTGCSEDTPPDWCIDRPGDADCDGTPDTEDQCDATPYNSLVDRRGCSENQAAGCNVTLSSPEDGERIKDDSIFRWQGNCEVYLLQFSDDPSFPLTATHTVARTNAKEVQAQAQGEWWRVVGGLKGSSAGKSTEARRIRGAP